jgi:hypothetical protein
LRKRWEPPIVVPKVKPPACHPLFKDTRMAGMYCCAHACFSWRMQPLARTAMQTLFSPVVKAKGSAEKRWVQRSQWGSIPKNSFANRREDGCLRDRVGVEIVQLHPVEMQNRPHETTCWHSEPPLMEGNETQHIPRRRGRGGSARRSHPLRLRVTREGTKQAIGNKGLQIVHHDGGERPRVARRNDGHPVGHQQAKEVAAERTRCAVFFL